MDSQTPPYYGSLDEYLHVRDAVLARVTALLAADARVGSAWLSGSFGRGEDDAWADLDLHVAIADEQLAHFLDERPVLYGSVGRPVLVQEEMPSNAMAGATFQLVIFSGPVEVDWNIGPVSRAVRPLAFRMLVDRVPIPIASPSPLSAAAWHQRTDHWLTFFWAMAPIAMKYPARGELHRAVNQVGLLSRAYIALWRLLHDSGSAEPMIEWTNRPLEAKLDAMLPQLGQQIDLVSALTTIEALCSAVERLHPALAERDVVIPLQMPDEVRRMGSLARRLLQQEAPSRRKYR